MHVGLHLNIHICGNGAWCICKSIDTGQGTNWQNDTGTPWAETRHPR